VSGHATGHGHGDVHEGSALGFGEGADPARDALQSLPVAWIESVKGASQRRALDHEGLTRLDVAEALRMLAQGCLAAPAHVVDG